MLAKLIEWLGMLLAVLLFVAGCSFHGKGVTTGSRELGLHYTVDTSLTWVTTTEDGEAKNEEWLGIVWTGMGPPPPPSTDDAPDGP